MLRLSTPVELPARQDTVSYTTPVLMLGSCFTDNIGQILKDAFFNVCVNPFGETYNPLSIAAILDRTTSGAPFEETDLVHHNGLWHSMMHHGSFSAPTKEETLLHINNSLSHAHKLTSLQPVLIITLGTAYVYEQNGIVVNNCHKMPGNLFTRRMLTIEEIAGLLADAINHVNYRHCILTVSPIRHLRDGAHANQVSKATLLLAAERLCQTLPRATYFPAYEIMLDELRDYRFYADNMTHPTPLASRYIFERFAQTFMSDATQQRMAQCQRLRQRLNHRALHPDSEEAKAFEQETRELAMQLGIAQ